MNSPQACDDCGATYDGAHSNPMQYRLAVDHSARVCEPCAEKRTQAWPTCDRCGMPVYPGFERDKGIQQGGAYRTSEGIVCVVCAGYAAARQETVARA